MTNYASFGTLLQIGDGATPENFTTVAQVRDITGPGFAVGTKDVTADTSAGAWREKVATLKDGGQVRCTITWDPPAATHDATTGILADMWARTLRNWHLVFPDAGAAYFAFAAFIVAFEPASPVDGSLDASVTLELSGAVTLTE